MWEGEREERNKGYPSPKFKTESGQENEEKEEEKAEGKLLKVESNRERINKKRKTKQTVTNLIVNFDRLLREERMQ